MQHIEEGTFAQQPPNEDSKPLRKGISFGGHDALHTVRSGANRAFRFHVLGGAILSVISIALWIFISFKTKTWPFFFYFINFFTLTASFHYYVLIRGREWFPLHVVWYCSINLMLILTWFFTINWEHGWFIYPLVAWGMLLAIHYLIHTYHGHPDLAIYIHSTFFAFTNALCFFIWMELNTMPFFIFVVFILGLPFSIHWCRHYSPWDKHKLHLLVFLNVNLLFFFVWVETSIKVSFPWFVFPLIIWGILLGIHFWKFPRAQPPGTVEQTTSSTPNPDLVGQTVPIEGSFSQPAQPFQPYSQPPPSYTPGQVHLEGQDQQLYPSVNPNQQTH